MISYKKGKEDLDLLVRISWTAKEQGLEGLSEQAYARIHEVIKKYQEDLVIFERNLGYPD